MSNLTDPTGLCLSGTYDQRIACREACTLSTCSLDLTGYHYRPSRGANGFFLALFSLSLILYITQALLSRRFLGFSIAMISGIFLEVLGYIGRILSWYDPFSENYYELQIITLTIAPAFLAAGIYFCLSRIVLTFGSSNSRIAALSYPRIFIPCDVISLLLQAAGGGWSAAASHANKDPDPGTHILVAGLAFQVLTLLIFILLAIDFAVRTGRRVRELGREGALDQTHARLRRSAKFRGFLVMLSFATLCIFTRCVYRVAELGEGWNGRLIHIERYFIGLEGAVVGAAVVALNVFHPGLCFSEGYEERKAFGFGRKKKAGVEESGGEPETKVVEQVPEI